MGNVLAGASRYGVLGTPGGVLGASLTVSSNTVEGDVTVGTNWTGISAHENTTVSANSIFVDSAAGSTGIALTGSNNLVQGNLIRSGAPSVPAVGLSVDGASTGNTVVSNAITANAALAINVNGASVNDASVGMGNYKVAG